MAKHHNKKRKAIPFPLPVPASDGNTLPPLSETRVPPDTQWSPIIPIQTPLKTVQAPFNTSSAEPDPQWASNVIIAPSVWCKSKSKHGRNVWGGCPFLRSHWKDDVPMYVYGKNPFSDTVSSGGSHFQ